MPDGAGSGAGAVVVIGGDGPDTIVGGAGPETIIGSRWFPNHLTAGSGDQSLYGGENDDVLTGGAGSDFLDGGGSAGANGDTLIAGTGPDTFVERVGYGLTTIEGFKPGTDVLDIFGFASYSLVQGPNGTIVGFPAASQFDAQGNVDTPGMLARSEVVLVGVNVSQLTAANFAVFPPASLPAEPSVPTPAVAPSNGVVVSSAYTVASTDTLYFNSSSADLVDLQLTSASWTGALFTNNGVITGIGTGCLTSSTSAVVSYYVPSTQVVVYNAPNAVMESLNGSGVYVGFGEIENAGRMLAVSDGHGVSAVYSATFVNDATGTVEAWSQKGLAVAAAAQFVQNAGTIEADGLYATAVENVDSLVNTGTITAIQNAPATLSRGSMGVYLNDGYTSTITNSGKISADYAIVIAENDSPDPGYNSPYAYPGGMNSDPARAVSLTLNNSGEIDGVIELGPGDNNITNTGKINGALYLSNGDNAYNGAGGTDAGGIYGGTGDNQITLGDDGETYFGANGNDTIKGGAGNDFIEIEAGNNSVDGGGGFNTLSFALVSQALTVNLGTGTATIGGSVDQISNIQVVEAGSGNDTLIAGASGAELVGGAGTDTLVGGTGADTLVAGTGGDVMTGGGGNDTFVYAAGDGRLAITDFNANGAQDTLAIYGYSGPASVVQQGQDVVLSFANGDVVTLRNTTVAALAGANIVYSTGSAPAVPVPGATPPSANPGPIEVTRDLVIPSGETLDSVGHLYALSDDGAFGSGLNGNLASITNYGIVEETADYQAIGLNCLLSAATGSAVFTNAAGAQFVVSNPGDDTTLISINGAPPYANASDAIGIYEPDPTPDIVNNGLFEVTSANGNAYGIDSWISQFNFTNNGQFIIKAALEANGARNRAFDNRTLTNTGTMEAIGQTAIVFDGAQTVNNSGVIKAISAPGYGVAFGFGYGSAFAGNNVRNTGEVFGQISLGFGGTYNGAGGYQVGGVSIGGGNNTVIGGYGRTEVILGEAMSQVSWTRSSDGSLTLTGEPNGADRLVNVDVLQFQGGQTVEFTAHADFVADGPAGDILIQNTSGAVVVGEAGAGGGETYAWIGGLGSEWSFVGTGDFLDEGHAQYLIENAAGALAIGDVQAGQAHYTGVGALGREWRFVGSGDFLGHAQSDFLIENASGAVDVGEIGSNGRVSYTQIAALGSEWRFVGSGDFLGAGHGQFLIENTAGAVFVGDVKGGHAGYTQVAALGSEWTFRGAGDFLGDGKADFLIENAAGAVVVGEVGANGKTTFTTVAGLGAEWKFVGVGDVLGAGYDQFLIENASGAVFAAKVQNGTAKYVQLGALGSEWSFRM